MNYLTINKLNSRLADLIADSKKRFSLIILGGIEANFRESRTGFRK